jgi:hypothetical protein
VGTAVEPQDEIIATEQIVLDNYPVKVGDVVSEGHDLTDQEKIDEITWIGGGGAPNPWMYTDPDSNNQCTSGYCLTMKNTGDWMPTLYATIPYILAVSSQGGLRVGDVFQPYIEGGPLTWDESTYIKTLDFNDGEVYNLVITPDLLEVYNEAGERCQLSSGFKNSQRAIRASLRQNAVYQGETDEYGELLTPHTPMSYLSGITHPRNEIRTASIADHTYIINRNAQVKATNFDDDEVVGEEQAIAYISAGDYSSTYKIGWRIEGWIKSATSPAGATGENIVWLPTTHGNDGSVSLTTNDTSLVANEQYIKTDYIASQLASALNGAANFSDYFTAVVDNGNLIVCTPKEGWGPNGDGSGQSIHLTAYDSRGGTHLKCFNESGTVEFSELPAHAPTGFKIKIQGNNDRNEDDYYVEYKTDHWEEVYGHEHQRKFDESTMPHVLIRTGTNEFAFLEYEWDPRYVGDDDLNPFPQWVASEGEEGGTINDIFFYRNRLGFLSGEQVTLSEVGSYWNFLATTTLVNKDSAPINIAVSTDDVNTLKYAVPFNDDLLLFSDNNQFKLTSGQVLAHDTIQVDVTTRFEADLSCPPLGAANFIFFATAKGNHGGVREYFTAGDGEGNNADDITSHIPSFIPHTLRMMTCSTTENMMATITAEPTNEVFLYNYYWVGKEKKQSAWHKWDMGGEVLNIYFQSSTLHVVVKRQGKYFMESINLSSDASDDIQDYGHGPLLDRRIRLENGWTTEIENIPYYDGEEVVVINEKGNSIVPALSTTTVLKEYITAYLDANPDDKLHIGTPYTFEYGFSEFLPRIGGSAVNPDNLTIKSLSVEFDRSASFEVSITPATGQTQRASSTREYGTRIGSSQNLIGQVNVDSGNFKIPVWGDSRHIRVGVRNATPYPSTFQSAEWEGTYVKHGREMK